MARYEKYLYPSLLLMVLSLIFFPAFFMNYGYSDDFSLFVKGFGPFPVHVYRDFFQALGRPGSTVYYSIASWLINDLDGLRILRYFALVQVCICGGVFMYFLEKILSNRLQAFLVSLMILTLPPFEVYISWSLVSHAPFALLLSILSAWSASKISINDTLTKRLINKFVVVSAVLLLGSCLIYQSGIAFYWVMVFLYLFAAKNEQPVQELFKKAVNYFYTGFLGLAGYFGYLQFNKHYADYVNAGNVINPVYNTTGLSFDVMNKLSWFVREPLFNTLNLWNVFPKVWVAVVIGGIIVITFLIKAVISKNKQQFWFFALLFIICFFMSFLPNLVSKGNAPFYRCCVGISVLTMVALVLSVKYWCSVLSDKKFKKLFVGLLFAGAIVGGFFAAKNVYIYRVLPSNLEVRYIKNAMQDILNYGKNDLFLVYPSKFAAQARYDEFGTLTTNFKDNIFSIYNCMFREIVKDKGWKIIGMNFGSTNDALVLVYKMQDNKDVNKVYEQEIYLRFTLGDKKPHDLTLINTQVLLDTIQSGFWKY
ncbi:MAG: glucosyltransferase domain-containing protein [Candidatus Omnitrophica bacterium]|nr:glucosyltransferase domain-containing protein [Candidatus Omnitrophota bacterium]